MEDERNQSDPHEAQGLAEDILAAADLRPKLFEVPAQSAVGGLHLLCKGIETSL
jgi:hypothetical protein